MPDTEPKYVGKLNFPEVERIIIGQPISEKRRKSFKICPSLGIEEKMRNKQVTGTIGFLDFMEKTRLVPPEYGKVKNVLEVVLIGIEPWYRRRGHGSKLLRKCEQIAKERGLDIVVLSNVQTALSCRFLEKNGYVSIRNFRYYYLYSYDYLRVVK